MRPGSSERWPTWASTGWGIAIRIVVASTGILAGAMAIFLAFFGATFKKYPAEWNLENLSLLVLGALLAVFSLWAAIRPSRVSVICLVSLLPIWALLPTLL